MRNVNYSLGEMPTAEDYIDAAAAYAEEARNAMEEARQLVHDATFLRDDMIRAARREGAPLREIGEAVWLSHTAVAKIVKKGT